MSSRHLIVLVPACLGVCAHALAQDERPGAATAKTLDTVQVRDERRPYRNLNVTGATKTDALIRDVPQNIQIIGTDLLRDVAALDLAGALDLSSSISRQSNYGGMWVNYGLRGFTGDVNFGSDYMVNGFNASRGYGGVRDNVNVESVELLKGPSSALYGRGEPGGTVNITTRKPLFKAANTAELSIGNWNNRRAAIDVTGPLAQTLAYRLSAAWHEGDSFRDTVEFDRYLVSPSLLWMVTPDTTLSWEMEQMRQRMPFDRGVVAVNGELGVVPRSNYYGEPNDGNSETRSTGHQLLLNHYFNDNWSIQTGFSYRDSYIRGAASEVIPYNALRNGQQLVRRYAVRDNTALDRSGRFEVLGKFNTGKVQHSVLFGVDGYKFSNWRYTYGRDPRDLSYAIDLMNPVYGIAKPDVTTISINLVETQDSYSYYVQDQMELSERWKVQMAVRHDEYEQNVNNMRFGTQTRDKLSANSPRAGVVFQPVPALSLYATSARSFRPNSGIDRNFNPFDPERGKSYEIGAKMDSFDGRLNTTVALYQITKRNVLTPDPLDPQNFNIAMGEVESKGLELDLNGQIVPGLRVFASLAYTNAKVVRDNSSLTGVDVIGRQLANVPRWAGNALIIKEFTLGGRAASLGGGIQHAGEREGTMVPFSASDFFTMKAWTTYSLIASWQAMPKLGLSLNVENLFDKEFYVSSYSPYWVYPGTERKLTLTARFSF